jgi:hypothetical protein
LFLWTAVLVSAVVSPPSVVCAQPIVGGYSTTAVTNKEVRAAAAFAIQAEEKLLREKNEPEPAKLELVEVVQAQQQVVAGMNFRLRLKVKWNGKEKTAEAVVWWQAWRRPEPYQLTSWSWKE